MKNSLFLLTFLTLWGAAVSSWAGPVKTWREGSISAVSHRLETLRDLERAQVESMSPWAWATSNSTDQLGLKQIRQNIQVAEIELDLLKNGFDDNSVSELDELARKMHFAEYRLITAASTQTVFLEHLARVDKILDLTAAQMASGRLPLSAWTQESLHTFGRLMELEFGQEAAFFEELRREMAAHPQNSLGAKTNVLARQPSYTNLGLLSEISPQMAELRELNSSFQNKFLSVIERFFGDLSDNRQRAIETLYLTSDQVANLLQTKKMDRFTALDPEVQELLRERINDIRQAIGRQTGSSTGIMAYQRGRARADIDCDALLR